MKETMQLKRTLYENPGTEEIQLSDRSIDELVLKLKGEGFKIREHSGTQKIYEIIGDVNVQMIDYLIGGVLVTIEYRDKALYKRAVTAITELYDPSYDRFTDIRKLLKKAAE